MSVDLLVQKIKEKGNPSVAGLDPKIEYVPGVYQKKAYAEIRTEFKRARQKGYMGNLTKVLRRNFIRCTCCKATVGFL